MSLIPLLILQRISQVPTSVSIIVPYYDWFECRYIGLLDYTQSFGWSSKKVTSILQNSDASKICSTFKATKNNIKGQYILAINESPVFTQEETISKLVNLQEEAADPFKIPYGGQEALNRDE